jgi:DHA1 family bicyclomycin/chloramphenicol resistance-like MFS transporter
MPVLLLMVILPMLATDVYLPAVRIMGEHFHVNDSRMTDTFTSYMLGYSLSLLVSGVLTDIYGRRLISIIGITIFAISSLGCFFVVSIEQLVACRFFQALGGGCGTLIARIIVRDIFDPKSQVKVLSHLATGLVVSPIFGPIFGAYISTYFGWRAIFLALALLSLCTLILLFYFMRESLPKHERMKCYQLAPILAQYLYLMRHWEFIFHTLIISFAWAVYFAFLSSSPSLIQGEYQVTPIEYGYLFSLAISGFILGAAFIRWRIASLELRSLIYVAGAIIFISSLFLHIVAISEVESLATLLALIFCALFGIGIIFPATQAGVTKPFTENFGLIAGLFYSTEMFFGAICGYMLSLSGTTSWEKTSLVMLISAAFIVLLLLLDKLYSLNNRREVIDRF